MLFWRALQGVLGEPRVCVAETLRERHDPRTPRKGIAPTSAKGELAWRQAQAAAREPQVLGEGDCSSPAIRKPA